MGTSSKKATNKKSLKRVNAIKVSIINHLGMLLIFCRWKVVLVTNFMSLNHWKYFPCFVYWSDSTWLLWEGDGSIFWTIWNHQEIENFHRKIKTFWVHRIWISRGSKMLPILCTIIYFLNTYYSFSWYH